MKKRFYFYIIISLLFFEFACSHDEQGMEDSLSIKNNANCTLVTEFQIFKGDTNSRGQKIGEWEVYNREFGFLNFINSFDDKGKILSQKYFYNEQPSHIAIYDDGEVDRIEIIEIGSFKQNYLLLPDAMDECDELAGMKLSKSCFVCHYPVDEFIEEKYKNVDYFSDFVERIKGESFQSDSSLFDVNRIHEKVKYFDSCSLIAFDKYLKSNGVVMPDKGLVTAE